MKDTYIVRVCVCVRERETRTQHSPRASSRWVMGEAVRELEPAVADTRVSGLCPRGVEEPLAAAVALITASLLITEVSVG